LHFYRGRSLRRIPLGINENPEPAPPRMQECMLVESAFQPRERGWQPSRHQHPFLPPSSRKQVAPTITDLLV